MSILLESETVDEFAQFGIRAFTTTRSTGTFGLASEEPTVQVMKRWRQLRDELGAGGARLASATQVHGTRVLVHHSQWEGWLRADEADGHVSANRGIALVVTVADCVPVFIAHPSGAAGILHSGWRGTAARIIEHGVGALAQRGFATAELRVHLGPAICGKCYEVGADVYRQLTGRDSSGATTRVDLRSLIADHARALGVRHITTSALCTRCNNDRFYSHRAGDAGRQIGVVYGLAGVEGSDRRAIKARREQRLSSHPLPTTNPRSLFNLTGLSSGPSLRRARHQGPRDECGGCSPHFFVPLTFLDTT